MTDQNPIGIPQWSIDFWNEKRTKLDEIILWIMNEIKDYEPHTEEADGEAVVKSFTQIIEKLEQFKEEEL